MIKICIKCLIRVKNAVPATPTNDGGDGCDGDGGGDVVWLGVMRNVVNQIRLDNLKEGNSTELRLSKFFGDI